MPILKITVALWGLGPDWDSEISNSPDPKGTVSPAERCDLVGVTLKKVHDLLQVSRICGKGVVFYNMPQYGLLYYKRLCN